jgi:long-chain acyl-CoA synthetase
MVDETSSARLADKEDAMSDGSTGPTARPLAGPGDILGWAAARHPDKTALITATRELSYGELDDLSARAAAGLRDRGVRPGQVVSLYGPNSWQWVVAYHAVLRAGAVVNPINVMLTPPEVAYVLTDCRSAGQDAGRGRVRARPGRRRRRRIRHLVHVQAAR